MKFLIVRRMVQLSAAGLLLLPAVWPANPLWVGTYLSSQVFGVALTDPLAAVEVTLAGKEVWWPLIWSVVPLLIINIVLGRIFCSWICPLNTIFEFSALVRTSKNNSRNNELWPYLLLAVLPGLALMIGLPLFTILSPIGLVSRAVIYGLGFELIFILLLVAAELFYKRKIWCRNLCPVGALYGLMGNWRQLTVKIDLAVCRNCRKCHAVCTQQVNVGSNSLIDRLTCTNCGDCIDVCPEKAVHFSWK